MTPSTGYLLAFIPGLLCPILLAMAFGIRSTGNNRAFGSVDYAAIADVTGFHRTVGNHLLWSPLCAAMAAGACFAWPRIAILWVTLFFLSAILIAVFAIGSAGSTYARHRAQPDQKR